MTWELINSDCVEYLKSLPDASVDNIFADPPYGVGVEYDGYEDTKENLKRLVNTFMPEALRVGKRVIITPGNGNQWEYPKPTWQLGFTNQAGSGRSPWGFTCYQPILAYGIDPYLATGKGARPDTMFMKKSNDIDKSCGHPCPKPNNVMRWIIWRMTLPGEMVLDPFCGSGTTGVACIELGRDFIGIDKSGTYIAIAKRRLSQARNPLLLPENPNVFGQSELW